MNYFVTAEKEVLREVAADINADIIKYMIAHKIEDDSNDPIDILGKMVNNLSYSLIRHSEYTMEDLLKIRAKLEFARDFINEVKN